MLFFRKIGKLLLGKATALQVLVATIVGAMLGFVPGMFLLGFGRGISDAPALVFTLVVVVLVLNTNLALFAVTFVLAKLAAVALLPVSFAVGTFLLDGPTQPVFRWLVNAPFFAWFGLERYATTGGLALGLVLGLLAGLLLLRGLRVLQARMANVEDSAAYQKWAGKFWVRGLSWLFLGIRPKQEQWSALLEEKRRGSPVRILGVVAVALIAAGVYVAQSFLAGPTLRQLAQTGLEAWNGATVDLARAGLDLSGGRMSIAGLALTDPGALDHDSFRARSLDLAVGTRDLLSRRFVIDEISSREASSGLKRTKPGVRIGKPTPPKSVPPDANSKTKTIEDYVKDAKKWKARLQRVSQIFQRLVGDGPAGAESEADRKRAADQAREHARLLGLARVTATHLISGSPRVWIRKLVFDGVRVAGLGEDLIDLRASNISSEPTLVHEPLTIQLASRSGNLEFGFSADPAKSKVAMSHFTFKGVSIDMLAKQLFGLPLKGGTLDLSLRGQLDCGHDGGTWLDLPVRVTLHDTTLAMKGITPTKLDTLTVPLGVRGPLAAPSIAVETKTFVDALVAAGKAELAKQVKSQVNALIGDQIPGGVGGKLGDVITGKKTPAQLAEEAKKRALEAAKKAAKKAAQSNLKKLLPKGLPGLFGGKKK